MKYLRLHWDSELGWILDVSIVLPEDTVKRAIAWALPKQIDKLRGLPPGERREELTIAVEKLRRGEVQQRLVDSNGDGYYDIFKSTTRIGTKVTSLPGK